jgi:hypothetical protein
MVSSERDKQKVTIVARLARVENQVGLPGCMVAWRSPRPVLRTPALDISCVNMGAHDGWGAAGSAASSMQTCRASPHLGHSASCYTVSSVYMEAACT